MQASTHLHAPRTRAHRPWLLDFALRALLLLGLTGLWSACSLDQDAADPWANTADGGPTANQDGAGGSHPDGTADGATLDGQSDAVPPQGWRPVDLGMEAQESVADWVGYRDDQGQAVLALLTNAGRFALLRDGQGELETVKPASAEALVFRGVWTADGSTFWVVGKGGTVRKRTSGMWSKVGQDEDVAADWTTVWGDGEVHLWFAGRDGALLRAKADGSEAQRASLGEHDWIQVAGFGAWVYLLAKDRVLRFARDADLSSLDASDGAEGVILASSALPDQVFRRLWIAPDGTVYLAGKPGQLLEIPPTGDAGLRVVVSGPNAFLDVRGDASVPGSTVYATGVGGVLASLAGGVVEPQDTEGLPPSFDLARVWPFARTNEAPSQLYVATTLVTEGTAVFFRSE